MSLTLDHGASAQARFTRLLHIAANATRYALGRVFAMIAAEMDRRQTMRLLDLDARDLSDLGITRNDVDCALSMSPGSKPSQVLAARRRESRAFNREQILEARAELMH